MSSSRDRQCLRQATERVCLREATDKRLDEEVMSILPEGDGRGDQEGPLVRDGDGGFFEVNWGQGFQQDEGSVHHVCGCCGLEAF